MQNLVKKRVSRILDEVAKKGDRALELFLRKYDGVSISARKFEVPGKRLADAFKNLEPRVKKSLETAKKSIEFFHKQELRRINMDWRVDFKGLSVGQKAYPMASAGVYIPGGRFAYPSTVLMTVVPAKVAGVREIVMVTPPNNMIDEVLAAAYIAGVDRCFSVGGPAAIAALAYGTKTIPKVHIIVGPGNVYVTEAKRQVFGVAGIDGLAGPSEVVVWADAAADMNKVALNLLAQAEHDPRAVSFLLVAGKSIADGIMGKVNECLKERPVGFKPCVKVEILKPERNIIGRINEIAPEHLYLAIKNPERVLPKITCAGAVFLGVNTPVPLGDYSAGPSHVLPTGASARFSSGLSVKDFLRWSSIIKNRTVKSSVLFDAAKTIAGVEGLHYHGKALGE